VGGDVGAGVVVAFVVDVGDGLLLVVSMMVLVVVLVVVVTAGDVVVGTAVDANAALQIGVMSALPEPPVSKPFQCRRGSTC
jgi:hypothetical protein